MKTENGPMIYVGPGYRDTDLATFKIYASGIPKEYVDHPIYKHLFVSPEDLDAARKEIREKGSLRNVFYCRAIEEHEKKGGK